MLVTMRYWIIYAFIFMTIVANGQQNQKLDSLYSGGSQAFYKYIGQHIVYADKSVVGTSIISWIVENGEIKDISIINSLGKQTDAEVIRDLKLTRKHWKAINSITKLYLPIKFRTGDLDYYVDEYPENYLDEVIIVLYKPTYHRIDSQLISEINENIKARKYEEAVYILDLVIMRNPLNQQIRETRIFCLNQLQMFSKACKDITFIKNELNTECKYACEIE